MSTGLLFVTAPEADHKTINAILIDIRDWDNNNSQDNFRLVTTKNAYDLDLPKVITPAGDVAGGETSPPLDNSLDNSWAGATLEDVETFCLDLERSENEILETSLYVLVDEIGLQTRTCVFGQRAFTFTESDEIVMLDKFNKIRVPRDEVYIIWVNIWIANMNFEEFTLEEDESDGEEPEDGWYTYQGDGLKPTGEDLKRKEKEIRRLEEAGHL